MLERLRTRRPQAMPFELKVTETLRERRMRAQRIAGPRSNAGTVYLGLGGIYLSRRDSGQHERLHGIRLRMCTADAEMPSVSRARILQNCNETRGVPRTRQTHVYYSRVIGRSASSNPLRSRAAIRATSHKLRSETGRGATGASFVRGPMVEVNASAAYRQGIGSADNEDPRQWRVTRYSLRRNRGVVLLLVPEGIWAVHVMVSCHTV